MVSLKSLTAIAVTGLAALHFKDEPPGAAAAGDTNTLTLFDSKSQAYDDKRRHHLGRHQWRDCLTQLAAVQN